MRLAQAIRRARRVFLCGNGGSAANALHLANDLTGCGIDAEALCADVSVMSMIANDYGWEEVFAFPLRAKAEDGDLLIALSGSGRSKNILRALAAAREEGATTFAVFGAWQEHSRDNVDHMIEAGRDMQEAEEYQIHLAHETMRELKK